jgi:hypothetical protein
VLGRHAVLQREHHPGALKAVDGDPHEKRQPVGVEDVNVALDFL